MAFDYFYEEQSQQFAFYRIPKVLFTDNRFQKISTEGKVLYGLLLDRVSLSRENGWIDEERRVYIIFQLLWILRFLNTDSYLPGSFIFSGSSPVLQNHDSLFIHKNNYIPVAFTACYFYITLSLTFHQMSSTYRAAYISFVFSFYHQFIPPGLFVPFNG